MKEDCCITHCILSFRLQAEQHRATTETARQIKVRVCCMLVTLFTSNVASAHLRTIRASSAQFYMAQFFQIVRQKEKDKRQKWLTLQTQRIKEATVKGLEPEIQRLIAQHKAEVRLKWSCSVSMCTSAYDSESHCPALSRPLAGANGGCACTGAGSTRRLPGRKP